MKEPTPEEFEACWVGRSMASQLKIIRRIVPNAYRMWYDEVITSKTWKGIVEFANTPNGFFTPENLARLKEILYEEMIAPKIEKVEKVGKDSKPYTIRLPDINNQKKGSKL